MTATLRLVAVGAVVVALVLALLWLQSCQRERGAKVETKLISGQSGAAVASGADAINTAGRRADDDAASDALGRENERAIRNAQGADTAVNPAARDAGLASLCRRRAYSGDPRCVQRPIAR